MYKRIHKLSNSQGFFLFGPRGSGKSTLLTQHFKKQKSVLWVDLLEQKAEFQLSQNPDSLLSLWEAHNKPAWIVVDEVQKIPRLLDVVHRGIEKYKIKFALTGSSSRKLKRGGANLLGGRAASFSLSPFSSFELGKDFNLHKALQIGLLPQFWSDQNMHVQDIHRSLYAYVQTYLKEEVAAEQLVRNLDPFRRLLVAAAQSNTKIINFSKLERDAGVSHSQAERHFEILCDTHLGRYLEPYSTSVRKRQSKKSKFYFFDTGVVRALNSVLDEPLSASTYDYGSLFENFLVNEFFKLIEGYEKRWQLSYFQTQDVEVDLIIEKPRGAPILIEIKSMAAVDNDRVRAFARTAKTFKGSPAYFLSLAPTRQQFENVKIMHWQEGLRDIFEL